jgi:hypothetical protein
MDATAGGSIRKVAASLQVHATGSRAKEET